MRVLVTGANGQLGMEMRNISRDSHHEFIFTDVNKIEGLNTNFLDITDAEAVKTMAIGNGNRVDVIINCAAYTNVDKAEEDYTTADKLNHIATQNLANAAIASGALLIHISTDYIFAGNACEPYTEDCTPGPQSVYGSTKLAGEKAILDSGCKYMIFRTAWLYSPYGKNFVKTIIKLTSEKNTLNVVFDQVGSPTCAKDLAHLIYNIIDNNMLDKTGMYHFSNEGVCSWYDFALAIRDLWGNGDKSSGHYCYIKPCRSNEFPSKVNRPHFSVLDKSKVKMTFGIEVPHWLDSLKICLTEIWHQYGNL